MTTRYFPGFADRVQRRPEPPTISPEIFRRPEAQPQSPTVGQAQPPLTLPFEGGMIPFRPPSPPPMTRPSPWGGGFMDWINTHRTRKGIMEAERAGPQPGRQLPGYTPTPPPRPLPPWMQGPIFWAFNQGR